MWRNVFGLANETGFTLVSWAYKRSVRGESRSGVRDKRDTRIRALHADGLSYRAIAALVGCSSATCQRIATAAPHPYGTVTSSSLPPLSEDAIELADLIENDLYDDTGQPSLLALHRLRYLDCEWTDEQIAIVAAAWSAVPLDPMPRTPSLYG